MSLEDAIKKTAELSKTVIKSPQYQEIYNLIVKGIEVRYCLPRDKVLQLLYAEAEKNNFYKGLEDNG